jgi:hypothetical protein
MQPQRNTMVSMARLIEDLLLGQTDPADVTYPVLVAGFKPSYAGNLSVAFTAGRVYEQDDVDTVAWGGLGTDTRQIYHQGEAEASTLTFAAAPATPGHSRIDLVQVTRAEVDENGAVLGYYNSAKPSEPLNGPANAGTSQMQDRTQKATLAIKAGTSGASPTAPTADAGYTALYTVTIPYGETTLSGGNVALVADAPFIVGLTSSHHTGAVGSAPKIDALTEIQNLHIIDAREYGVLADGTTDDLAALNLALAAMSPGDELRLPGGVMIVSDTVTLPVGGITITGVFGKSTIKAKSGEDFEFVVNSTGLSNIRIANLVVDANKAGREADLTTRTIAMNFTSCNDCLVEGSTFKNAIGSVSVPGVGLSFGGTSARNRITNCIATDCGVTGKGSDGFYTSGSKNQISNCLVTNCNDTGFVIETSNESGISDCSATNVGCGAAITNASASAVRGNTINNLRVYDWNAPVTGGIQIGNPDAATVGNLLNTKVSNVILTKVAGLGPAINVRKTGTAKTIGLTLHNITVEGASLQGMLVDAENVTISDCQVTSTGTCIAISTGSKNVIIHHNEIYPLGTFAVTFGGVTTIHVQSNIIDGVGGGSWGIYGFGTSTNVRTDSNTILNMAIGRIGAEYGTAMYAIDQKIVINAEPTSGKWLYGMIGDNSEPAPSEPSAWTCITGGVASDAPWVTLTAVALGALRHANSKVYVCTVAGTTGAVAPSHSSGTATDGSVTWAYADTLAVFREEAPISA